MFSRGDPRTFVDVNDERGCSMKTLTRSARRLLLTAAAAGIVAAAIGGASLARAGGTASDTTFTLNALQEKITFVSVTHTAQGAPGDELIFRSALTDAGGTRIGALDVVCTLTFGDHLQCLGTYKLPGGTLVGSAVVPNDENSTKPVQIAITGGTGRYEHARGQITSTPVNSTTNRDVVDLD
jgi:hypothetical protein